MAALLVMVFVTGLFLTTLGGRGNRGYAAALTPPPPPTFVPTPIGPPPGPPTPVATAATSPTAQPATPATTTPTAVAANLFALDAARVSRLHNPGDFSGLAAIKPGSRVELMMYYTVSLLQTPVTRSTTYTIQYHGKLIYKVIYKERVKIQQTGRFSRYTVYVAPRTLPLGSYSFKATLSFGRNSDSKVWKFLVAKQERPAATGSHG